MKVSALIKALQACDPNAIVVLSTDAEGNDHRPVSYADASRHYCPDPDGHSGEVRYLALTPELERRGFGEEDLVGERPNAVPCVVLFPT